MSNWTARLKSAISNMGQVGTDETDETPLLSVLSVPPGAVYQFPDRLSSVSSVGVWAVFENTQLASDLIEAAMKVCDHHGDGENARAYLEKCPPSAEYFSALACCCFRQKDCLGAIDAANACLEINPNNPAALHVLTASQVNGARKLPSVELTNEPMAYRRLREGNFVNGFRLLGKMQGKLKGVAGAPYMVWRGRSIPRWNGSRVGHLMLVASQGRGDALQFVRWCFEAQKRVEKLSVVVEPELVDLFRRSGLDAYPSDSAPMILATADAQQEMILLPCSITLGYEPSSAYLRAEPQKKQDKQAYRIGVCWSSSKDDRSAPLESLDPLRKLEGVEFYSLAYHVGAPDWMRPMHVENLAQVADLMANLDLVISVDTVTCHLAGALGRPVWIALTEPTEWRWQTGETSPWYSTARLFRGEWADIFRRMADDLLRAGDRP